MTGTVIRGDLEAQGLDAGHMYYVDGSRSDAYTETGSYLQPYKTVQAAFTAIETAAQAHIDASDMANSRFKLHIGAGTYNETMTLYGKARYLAIIGDGVTLDGTIALTTSEQSEVPGGSGYHYHRYEFIGGEGNRAYRGDCFRINAPITATRNNDSLFYLSFIGTNLMCDIDFPTYGTFVLYMENCYHNDATKSITGTFASSATSYCLLETRGATKLLCTLAGDVCLYDCDGTYFNAINTTPYNQNSRVTDSTFNGSVTIAYVSAKTMSMDSLTYASFVGRTPTVSNLTYSLVDNTVVNVADSSSATCWPCLFEAATGIQGPKTDAALLYNASTGALSATRMGVGSTAAPTDILNATASATLGTAVVGPTELLVNGTFDSDLSGWTAGANWAWGAGGTADHSAGSVETLTQTIATTSGQHYQVTVVLSAVSASNVVMTLTSSSGSETFTLSSATTYTYSFKAGAASSTLTFTPNTAFVGSITSVSFMLITPASVYALATMDSAGARSGLCSVATDDTLLNCFIGVGSGVLNTTGNNNIAVGSSALAVNTTGNYNCAFGWSALAAVLTSSENTAIGMSALAKITTSQSTALGRSAGRYYGSGSDSLTSATQCVYLGASSRANANTMTNEIVIGYNAIGAGSNTATLGNTSIVQTQLRGNFGTLVAYGTSAAGVLGLASGTAPTTSPADAVQMWSGDFNAAAGKAALHLRDESGVLSVFGNNWGLFTAGAEVIDATANKCLFLSNGTAPSAHTDDGSYIYAADSSDSLSSLCFYTEQDVEDIGSFTATKKIKIRWNGLEYWVALDAVA